MKIKLLNGNTYSADVVTDYNITLTVDLNEVSAILSDMTEENMKKIELLDGSDVVCGEYANKALDHAEMQTKGDRCVLTLIMYDTVPLSDEILNILLGGE